MCDCDFLNIKLLKYTNHWATGTSFFFFFLKEKFKLFKCKKPKF